MTSARRALGRQWERSKSLHQNQGGRLGLVWGGVSDRRARNPGGLARVDRRFLWSFAPKSEFWTVVKGRLAASLDLANDFSDSRL